MSSLDRNIVIAAVAIVLVAAALYMSAAFEPEIPRPAETGARGGWI